MSDLIKIFSFGAPYLKKYWFRLVAGILLGVLFGLSNATFVVATKALVERLTPKTKDTISVPTNGVTTISVATVTNHADELVLSNSQPALLLSNSYSVRVKIDPHVTQTTLTSGADESIEKAKKKFKLLSKITAAFSSAIDPWLPSLDHSITVRQIIGGFLFLPILIAFRGFIGYLSSYCLAWVSERVIRDLRLDLLTKLNSLSLDYFNRATIGELLARVNGDTGALYRCLSLGFSDLIKEPITIVSILGTLFWMNWKLTLMALVFTPLTLIPIRVLGKKVRRSITSTMTAGMSQDSLLVESFTSIRVVKAFCLEKLQLSRFEKIYSDLVRIGMKSVQARELVNPIVETISALGLGIVILFIFVYHVPIGDLMGFLIGVTTMYAPIKKLGNIHVYFQQAGVGANRLVEIFKEQPSVQEKPDAKPLPQFARELKFENVGFAYPARGAQPKNKKEKPVLQNFSLTIPRGMKLGIAGESGSGKSTLINLVFRFYDPTTGRILIDGVDLRDVSVFDLRQQMALVSQEVVIFDQSVADNIACGKEGATRQEIEAAAKAASVHNFIVGLPQGYDTRVGERGTTLSGGQRQRIAIARAFIRNAPILVLDEATAALDSQAEAKVQAAIDRLAENRTVICIAHRLSTLASMDRILVLKDGVVVEQGTFAELVAMDGVFADMARKQGISSPPATA